MQGLITRGGQSEERKTRFFPRSLVQGMTGRGPETERHPAAMCEKRWGALENKQTHKLEHMLKDHIHVWITELVRTSDLP